MSELWEEGLRYMRCFHGWTAVFNMCFNGEKLSRGFLETRNNHVSILNDYSHDNESVLTMICCAFRLLLFPLAVS
jgi:hypothetical protein